MGYSVFPENIAVLSDISQLKNPPYDSCDWHSGGYVSFCSEQLFEFFPSPRGRAGERARQWYDSEWMKYALPLLQKKYAGEIVVLYIVLQYVLVNDLKALRIWDG